MPLSEDVYQKLKAQLTVRTGDKDSDVRVQAVVALSGLQDSGDTYGNRDVTNAILNVMQNDPSA